MATTSRGIVTPNENTPGNPVTYLAAMADSIENMVPFIQAGRAVSGPTPGTTPVSIQQNIPVYFPRPFGGTPVYVIPNVLGRRLDRTWTVNVDSVSANGFYCSISVSQPATTNNFNFNDDGLVIQYIAIGPR